MIVMKFGGTSVGIPDRFAVATRLVAERAGRDPIVVVSALAGITNLLVEFCRGGSGRAEAARRFETRHREFAGSAGVALETLEPLLRAWEIESAGWLDSPRVIGGADRDRVLSFGERLGTSAGPVLEGNSRHYLERMLENLPDRDSYVTDTSEFDLIRDRLSLLTRGRALNGGRRPHPTLRRRTGTQ